MNRTILFFITAIAVLTALSPAQAKPIEKSSPAAFEGVWESCFRFSPSDKDNYARYGGGKICSGFALLQKGKNVCGTWQYFATVNYPGKIQAVQSDNATAHSKKICGRAGSYTQTECEQTDGSPKPSSQWEGNSQTTLKICQGKLFSNYMDEKDRPFSDCRAIKKSQGVQDAMTRKALTKNQKQELLQDVSIQQCLNNQE